MATFRIRQAAQVLGVSDDTVRRWAESGRLESTLDEGGRQAIDGAVLARFAEELAAETPRAEVEGGVQQSARNRFTGLITKVTRDTVMAQVEMLAGPFRVVSLMSREAADDLGLEPGVLAAAVVKATNVVIETPNGQTTST